MPRMGYVGAMLFLDAMIKRKSIAPTGRSYGAAGVECCDARLKWRRPGALPTLRR